MKKYLLLCIDIEETAAQIYQQLAKSTNLPGELKVILNKLATDEEDHAMQLRFFMRFPAGVAVVEKSFDITEVKSLLSRAKNLLLKTRQQGFDARQAISLGIELEEDFCQIHIGNSVDFRDESLKKMFAALAQDDKIHHQKLIDAKARFF